MLGIIREPRADVLMAFPTVGGTSSPRQRAYFEEHGRHTHGGYINESFFGMIERFWHSCGAMV
jgi:hypothetical protein